MLFLILINVQYLQNVVFSFENGWNGPDHSSLVSHHPEKNSPYCITLFGKPSCCVFVCVSLWYQIKVLVNPHYVSDFSKLETLLHKTHDNVLPVVSYKGSTYVGRSVILKTSPIQSNKQGKKKNSGDGDWRWGKGELTTFSQLPFMKPTALVQLICPCPYSIRVFSHKMVLVCILNAIIKW